MLFLHGCASQPVSFSPNVKPHYLEVCLDFAVEMENEDKLLHLDAVNTFIGKYNARTPYYELRPCSQGKTRTVKLIIQNTRYVPPNEQALYVLISSAGIYSLLNGGIGIVWGGMSTTTLGVDLSGDLTDKPKTVYKHFYSSPYFYDLPAVKLKHMKQFQTFMFELLDELKISESSKELSESGKELSKSGNKE